MQIEHIERPDGMPPGLRYSHVVISGGPIAAIAGQVAMDADGALVGAGDVGAQAAQAFENIRLALAAFGADLSHVVKLCYYLTDISGLPAVRVARDAVLDPAAPPPASTAVQVGALFRPEFLVEIEAWASVPEPRTRQ